MGPGLIGGSVLRATRRFLPNVELRACARRAESVDYLRKNEGLVDFASDSLVDVIAGVDLVILAMPTGSMASVVEMIGDFTALGSPLVTDVGSVKAPVMNEVAPLVEKAGSVFVGSHPMAGSEKVGVEHSSADLFQDAAVILTPDVSTPQVAVERLTGFWEALGAKVSSLGASEHDQIVASISHLPHLLAAALVNQSLGDSPSAASYCGGGFRDTTRVASGPEEMWSGILADNHEAVSARLASLIDELKTWQEALDELDRDKLRSFLSRSRELRASLR